MSLGLMADGDRIFESPINHGRDAAGNAQTTRFVFAAARARLGRNYRIDSQLFLSSGASPFRLPESWVAL